ncbi:hypothetical protein CRUP_028917, partial [Coryphaenoides rupestris]
RLIQHPELSNSQLLADFLSPYSMESQFLERMLPDVNLGKIFKSVPGKLIKERGQNLDLFLQSFLNSCESPKAKPSRPEITVLSPSSQNSKKVTPPSHPSVFLWFSSIPSQCVPVVLLHPIPVCSCGSPPSHPSVFLWFSSIPSQCVPLVLLHPIPVCSSGSPPSHPSVFLWFSSIPSQCVPLVLLHPIPVCSSGSPPSHPSVFLSFSSIPSQCVPVVLLQSGLSVLVLLQSGLSVLVLLQLFSELFRNNANLPDGAERRPNHNYFLEMLNINGLYDFMMHVGREVFRMPVWLHHTLCAGRILFKRTFEAYLDQYMQSRLDQLLQEHRLVSLITQLRDAVFCEASEDRTSEDRSQRAKRTFEEMMKYLPDVVEKCIGEDNKYEGIRLLFRRHHHFLITSSSLPPSRYCPHVTPSVTSSTQHTLLRVHRDPMQLQGGYLEILFKLVLLGHQELVVLGSQDPLGGQLGVCKRP